ncbi:plasmid mobilization protein [Algoriphagus algorifonticola]|uniref:plasmid mobilization protein n=1 Tax=Algoriphagus algorifonticola TaxID=2593007 RepID=UPI0011A69A51|nr:plasmid mobilization relaxosome protein MobC [Algoriphagus algorifonticola]
MKEKNNNRNKWLHLRLNGKEYEQIQKGFATTIYDKISDYARCLLLKKPVIAGYKDTTMQDILAGLTALRKDLHGVAVNYNQAVKKLNALGNLEATSYLPQLEKEHKKVLVTLQSVDALIHKITEKWLRS